MATVSLVFDHAQPGQPGQRFQAPRTVLGEVTLDATVTEAHDYTAEVTRHPVEVGSSVTDHVRPNPPSLTLTGVVTDTPASYYLGAPLELHPGRAHRAFEALRTMLETGQLVTVVTRLRTYESMVMTALRVPREAKAAGALQFTATLEHVRLVRTAYTEVQRKEKGKGKQDGKKDQGGKTTAPAPEPLKSTAKKYLPGLFKQVFGGGEGG